jgi:hypothetical protein
MERHLKCIFRSRQLLREHDAIFFRRHALLKDFIDACVDLFDRSARVNGVVQAAFGVIVNKWRCLIMICHLRANPSEYEFR